MKTDYLQIRISPQVKKALFERAAAIGMSSSEYVRMLILTDIREADGRKGMAE